MQTVCRVTAEREAGVEGELGMCKDVCSNSSNFAPAPARELREVLKPI